MSKEKILSALGIILIVFFFILSSYIVQSNLEDIQGLIRSSPYSMVIYFFVAVIAIVFAPLSSMPLLPIIANVYGWFLAAILSIIAWTVGAIIAFILARKYGAPLVKRFVPMRKIERFERFVPEENIFWTVVFLRMAIPVDILSYLLGLFSRIHLRKYALATLIGVTPFAFIFAYVGTLSFYFQATALFIALLFILIGFGIRRWRRK